MMKHSKSVNEENMDDNLHPTLNNPNETQIESDVSLKLQSSHSHPQRLNRRSKSQTNLTKEKNGSKNNSSNNNSNNNINNSNGNDARPLSPRDLHAPLSMIVNNKGEPVPPPSRSEVDKKSMQLLVQRLESLIETVQLNEYNINRKLKILSLLGTGMNYDTSFDEQFKALQNKKRASRKLSKKKKKGKKNQKNNDSNNNNSNNNNNNNEQANESAHSNSEDDGKSCASSSLSDNGASSPLTDEDGSSSNKKQSNGSTNEKKNEIDIFESLKAEKGDLSVDFMKTSLQTLKGDIKQVHVYKKALVVFNQVCTVCV